MNQILKLFKKNYINQKPLLVIPIFYILLFIIDYLGIMNLFGENYMRRLINMCRRKDPLTYEKKLKPFCQKYEKMVSNDDIRKLQSIKLKDKLDIPFFVGGGIIDKNKTKKLINAGAEYLVIGSAIENSNINNLIEINQEIHGKN